MNTFHRSASALLLALTFGPALAQVTTIPNSALTASNSLYTNNFGAVVVTNGGGNANNAGLASGRNDDGFRGSINFGYTLTNFFGGNYSSFYANNNGNITFTSGLAAFTPSGPQGATQPVIAPFFADVDTRGSASGVLHLNQSTANQTVLTWDHVGYFGAHDDLLNTFQLIVRGPDYVVPVGEGTIGFFYGDMRWETGDASGGAGGFGGSPAAVGFGDGQLNGFVLGGSTLPGIAATLSNHYIWFNINEAGDPIPVPTNPIPEPETYALMLLGLAAVGAVSRRRKSR